MTYLTIIFTISTGFVEKYMQETMNSRKFVHIIKSSVDFYIFQKILKRNIVKTRT